MIRSKLGLLGLCAMVLGVMAISASAAQAAGSWLVESTEIVKSGEGVNLLVEVVGQIEGASATLLTHLVGLKVGVTCTAFTAKNIHLGAEGKLTEGGKVVFTGCKVTEGGSACTVNSPSAPNGTVESAEGKGELVLHTLAGGGTEVLTKLEPKSEEVGFATLRFGGECALPESNKVNGVLYVKDCRTDEIEKEGKKEKICLHNAETLEVQHLIEQGPLTSLTVGKDTVEHLETSIDGSALAELASPHNGLKWRAMGV
jgi:hypothetical protein